MNATTYALYQPESDIVTYFCDLGDNVEVVSAYRGEVDDDSERVLMFKDDARKLWRQVVEDGAVRTA